MTTRIKLNCPGCDKRLKVARSLVGKRMQCTDCGDIFYLKQVSKQEYLDFIASKNPGHESSEIQIIDEPEHSDEDLPVAEVVD